MRHVGAALDPAGVEAADKLAVKVVDGLASVDSDAVADTVKLGVM